MNDTAQQTPIHPSNIQPQGSIGAAKESEPVVENTHAELSPIMEIGRDMELSPTVSAAGVSVQPTIIPIPSPLKASGVLPAGQNISVGTGEEITLPLTSDEIRIGLKQPPTSSLRFLATWCTYKLAQMRRVLSSIGRKTAEVSA
jgi:hypothetical protein